MFSLTFNNNPGLRISLLLELKSLDHRDFEERRFMTRLIIRF